MDFKNQNFLATEELFLITKELSSFESGLLISTLTKVWLEGKNQSQISFESFKSSDIESIKKLCESNVVKNHRFLSTNIDFNENGMEEILCSQYLKTKFEKYKNEKLEQDLLSERLAKKQKKNKTMLEMVNEKYEPTRLFIPAEQRNLATFNGWFPLTTFEEDGAAFNLREEHISYLKDKFDGYGIDLESQFCLMFNYLKPRYKRKKFGHMNNFMLNWISNHIRSNAESLNKDKIANSLIGELTQLIESNNSNDNA